jgi:hypothetical protein
MSSFIYREKVKEALCILRLDKKRRKKFKNFSNLIKKFQKEKKRRKISEFLI